MSDKSNDIDNDDKTSKPRHFRNHQAGGMTPSIITTINNTSPTPILNSNNNNNTNNTGNTNTKTKRTAEPFYESYIEDSFVGHWEREDDDTDMDPRGHRDNVDESNNDDDDALHPSTIEFDFDSFGPESFIYTPQPARATTQGDHGETKVASIEKVEDVITKTDEAQSMHEAKGSEGPSPPKLQAANAVLPDYLVDTAQIDYRVIEPYKKVISHAGYCHQIDPSAPEPKSNEPMPAVIVFSACYLPDRSRRDYNYVMDHLFLYVLSSLHELIADDYILIYLHNTQPSTMTKALLSRTISSTNLGNGTLTNEESQAQNNLPTFTWMKRCYQMIDRKLRKNLKILYLVKPTFWLKTIVIMCKPFISAKFSKKLHFVEDMDSLKKCLPIDQLTLPASAQNI